MTKKTILIFGISSFVGSNLADFFKKDYKVVGTYYTTPIQIPGVLTIPCDVTSKEEVQLVMFAFKPDISIYSVGLTSIVDCNNVPGIADQKNTIGLFNVTDSCQRYKSQVVYISSSHVFGGENKVYMEMDIPDSNTVYGKTKASAEFFIQKTSLNYLIFRCCPLYGRSINPFIMTTFEKIQHRFLTNLSLNMDDTVKTGFLDVSYLAMLMKISFEQDVSNRLFQISTTDVITNYEFTKLYAKIFNESSELIGKGRWIFPLKGASNTAYHFEMDVSNIESFLNVKLPSIKESIEYTYKKFLGIEGNKKKQSSGDGIKFI